MISGWLILYGMVTIVAIWLAVNSLRHPQDDPLLFTAVLLIAIGCGVIPGGMWLIGSNTLSLPEWWAPGVRWKMAATALEAGVSLADVAAAMRIDPEGVQLGLVWWMAELHRGEHGDAGRFARLAELIGLTSPTRR